jgi:hypothetical protein
VADRHLPFGMRREAGTRAGPRLQTLVFLLAISRQCVATPDNNIVFVDAPSALTGGSLVLCVDTDSTSDRDRAGVFNRSDKADVILGIMFGKKDLIFFLVDVGFLLGGVRLAFVHSRITDREDDEWN